jgi:chromate transporter
MADEPSPPGPPIRGRVGEVFVAFLRLGLTSFGGPIAHLGYFREEFVSRRRWLDDAAYAELVALCQFLPGPASSQVGLGIGLMRAGLTGSVAAWLGFTLPSAVIMLAFALGIEGIDDLGDAGWLRGLKAVAVAVVAHAIIGMARTFSRGLPRALLTLAAAAVVFLVPGFTGQLAAIALGAGVGMALAAVGEAGTRAPTAVAAVTSTSRRTAGLALLLFAVLFAALPLAAAATDVFPVRLFDAFYRTGSLVFGGGHVVLPLLEAVVVEPGWVSEDRFLAGYSAAQAVPGPLFTLAAYLGAAQTAWPAPVAGAATALGGIFLPSFLLVAGFLPLWQRLRARPRITRAMAGVNAAVVGLLVAVFFDPVLTAGVRGAGDAVLAVLGFVLLAGLRWPAWAVVLLGAGGGAALGAIAG